MLSTQSVISIFCILCILYLVILYLEADKELETATAFLLPRTHSYIKQQLLLCAEHCGILWYNTVAGKSYKVRGEQIPPKAEDREVGTSQRGGS